MTLLKRILTVAAAAAVVLLVLTVLILRTDWFRDFVRRKIIAAVEEATGGRVEIGSFQLDWRVLRATVHNLTIHGTEPESAAPFVTAKSLTVELKLLTGLSQAIDLRRLAIEEPRVNIIVNADGSTNIPSPKVKAKPGPKTPLETVVDLAVDHFELNRGLVQFADRQIPLDARGENITARLDYRAAAPRYEGKLTVTPLHLRLANNQPLDLDVSLPVTIERNRVQLAGGRVATQLSEVLLDGQLIDLRHPVVTAHAKAKLAIVDANRFAGLHLNANGEVLAADAAVRLQNGALNIESARVQLGGSTIEAAGPVNEGIEFDTAIDLAQLAQLARADLAPSGTLRARGKASLRESAYLVEGSASATGVSVRQGKRLFDNIGLASGFRVTNERIELQGIRFGALGGGFSGRVAIEAFERLTLDGRLDALDIQSASAPFLKQPTPYHGRISGPVNITANLKSAGASGLTAGAKLTITPGAGGVPVSGQINATYRGADQVLELASTVLQLPHSHLRLDGATGSGVTVDFTSSDLRDFVQDADFPLVLGAPARFSGVIGGTLREPAVTGRLTAGAFLVRDRRFDSLAANLAADRAKASLENGVLARGSMRMSASGALGLEDWQPVARSPLSLSANVRNGDLADVMALANQTIPLSGALTASANIAGTYANPTGYATVSVLQVSAYDEPFDRFEARADFTDRTIRIPAATLLAGPSRLDLTASFQHPPDTLTSGRIQAELASNDIAIERLQRLRKERPDLSGVIQLKAAVSGDLAKSEFLLTGVDGQAALRNLRSGADAFGHVNFSAETRGRSVVYSLQSDLAQGAIAVSGDTQLQSGYPTRAEASVRDLRVERLLQLARLADIPVRGTFAAKANLSGPIQQLSGNADLQFANGEAYGEEVEKIAARLELSPQQVTIPALDLFSGPARLSLRAAYRTTGEFDFQITGGRADLSASRNLQQHRPGLGGLVTLAAEGAGVIETRDGQRRVLPRRLTADLNAANLQRAETQLGTLAFQVRTSGDTLHFKLNSDLTQARIEGSGQASLRGDYPLQAQLAVDNLTYRAAHPLLPETTPISPLWDVESSLRLTLNGPLLEPSRITGALELPTLRVNARTSAAAGAQLIRLENPNPIRVTLNREMIRIRAARLIAPETDIRLAGAIPIGGDREMSLNLSAILNIGLAQDITRSIYSSGRVVMQAVARGTLDDPSINGRLELRNASLNYIELPNGLSNANGVIVFNGRSVNVQNLTAESGGGQIRINGFAAANAAGGANYNLRATAKAVRVRMNNGLSVVASANAAFTGNSERSLLSGAATVESIGFSPRQDFGSMLSQTAEPVQTAKVSAGPLEGMRLDVNIRTAPSASFVTAMAQNLQADASLNLRGTLANPGLVGRVNITEGQLVFFGSQYRVNQGTVAFYNPTRIEPILNVDLQTVAKGVSVNLNVAGPIDNMKLTYTSDPPLQFNEVVALLATGRTPTSDPNLLAREPAAPQQSLQQMGGSAILSAAVANPVSSRLERVFGVSKLKIDPAFTSGSELPQARLTLQQQITSRITFTYITNLAQTNAQIVRMEWALDDAWSAIATREENGRFGIDFFFKKQFR